MDEDLFGSSSDSDDSYAEQISQLCMAVVTQCDKHYTSEGVQLLPCLICLTADDDAESANTLRQRLAAHATLTFSPHAPSAAGHVHSAYDACLLLPPLTISDVCTTSISSILVPHGLLLFASSGVAASEHLFEPRLWLPATQSAQTQVAFIRSAAARVNAAAGGDTVDVRNEQRLMGECVVTRSLSDIADGRISHAAHQRAVLALRNYGVCIIPSFFDPELVRRGGECAVADVKEAVERLEREHEIVLTPSPPPNADFEAYAAMDCQMVRGHADKFTLRRGAQLEAFGAEEEEGLRHNSSLVAILEEASLAAELTDDPSALSAAKSLSMLRRSTSLLESQPLGAVVSLGGATEDQLLHVDTEHLYEHTHLPPHYLVMFLPALHCSPQELEGSHDIGQTAFVAGSHRSSVAKLIAAPGVSQAHSERWSVQSRASLDDYGTIRPHCKAGDVVLFDARIMHFGIANRSVDTARPLLFVNYNRPWFSDHQPGAEIIVRHK